MEPLGVHHVSINVTDVEAAVRFYVDDLGFRRRDDRPDFGIGGAWLDVGDDGQQLHLIELPPPDAIGQHYAVRVADLASTVDELRAKGHVVTDISPVGTSLQAFVNDPSGNQVELHQVGGAA